MPSTISGAHNNSSANRSKVTLVYPSDQYLVHRERLLG